MPTLNSLPTLPEIVDNLSQVHTSVSTAQRVLRLLQRADLDMRAVVTLLESDPALATQILRLVNSSYFGCPQKISRIQQAISVLGARTLRLTLLNYGIMQGLAKTVSPQLRERFFRDSLTTAVVAERLARLSGDCNPDDAYCAGLIADIGSLALLQFDSARYQDLYSAAGTGADLLREEHATYRFSHAQLGAKLLESWNLPQELIDAALRHHELPTSNPSETLHVATASLVAHVLWTPSSLYVAECRDDLQQFYHMNLDSFIELAVDCQRRVTEQADLMGISVQEAIDVAELQRHATQLFVAASVATAVECDALTSLIDEPLMPPL